jgi:rhodanese-related sulfurtransferase
MPVPRISKEELKQRFESDQGGTVQVLDVRLKYPYEHSSVRLPASIRMTVDAIDVSRLARGKEVVVYDSDLDEVTSAHVAAELIRQGYRACALKGGIAEWLAANFPIEPKESFQSAPPAPAGPKA